MINCQVYSILKTVHKMKNTNRFQRIVTSYRDKCCGEEYCVTSVSIGIVTYNNEDKICALLESLYQYTQNVNFQIYVVDNASSDNTVQLVKENYPKVNLLQMGKNIGFGAGHNQVISYMRSDYHVIVNPDIRLCSNVICDLVKYLNEHSDVVMVSPKILNADGTEQHLPKKRPRIRYLLSGKLENTNKFFNHLRCEYTRKNRENDNPMEVDFLTGCFVMMRSSVFKQLGGFDDNFFLYLEDADLTLRAKQCGKVIFYPRASVIHSWERASSKKLKFLLIHIDSMRKFMWKWRKN